MFYYKNFEALRFREYRFNFPNKAVGQHFMFLEDANDIVNTLGIPYQHQPQTVPDNMTIIVKHMPNFNVLDINLLNVLKEVLKFKTVFRYQQLYKPELDVFLGQSDLVIMPYTHLSSTITLHPTFQYHDRIWVKDLPYTASKSFFLESFHPILWLTFLGIFMLCLLLSWCISKILKNYIKHRIEPFNIVSLILDQGVEHVAPIWADKIVLFSLAILLIIFFCGFGAFLSSLLAITKIALPFNDLNGAFTQNEYTLCLQQRTMSNLMVNIEKKRNIHFIANVNTDDCPEQFRRLRDNLLNYSEFDCDFERVVFITPGNLLNFRKFSKLCNISPLPGKYFRQDTSFMLNPGFKQRKILNRMLVQFRTSGLLRNEFLRIETLANSMEPSKNLTDEELQSITFYQIHLILVMFLVGLAVALMIFLIEYKRR